MKYIILYTIVPQIMQIIISMFIISMTKLLDPDWSRGVQLFHQLYSCTINDFFKTNKMADRRNLNTSEIALQETKFLYCRKYEQSTKFLAKSLTGAE